MEGAGVAESCDSLQGLRWSGGQGVAGVGVAGSG